MPFTEGHSHLECYELVPHTCMYFSLNHHAHYNNWNRDKILQTDMVQYFCLASYKQGTELSAS